MKGRVGPRFVADQVEEDGTEDSGQVLGGKTIRVVGVDEVAGFQAGKEEQFGRINELLDESGVLSGGDDVEGRDHRNLSMNSRNLLTRSV
jgi:hypothetical protein